VEEVSLRPLSDEEALDIIEGRRRAHGWAEDFPTATDVGVARRVRGSAVEGPWSSTWLILANEVVVGMLGFKGPPAHGAVDVGYGIVPSHQRRGIAATALGLLLDDTDSRRVDVCADTAAWNVASQGVLRRHGFVEVARSANLEDGELIRWRRTAPGTVTQAP
jgi:RimJ/RimL family protein N-acetyltransferase